MDLADFIGQSISTYPANECGVCEALAWTDSVLRLAYASGDVEIANPKVVEDLKRDALSLRRELIQIAANKKLSDRARSCGTLINHQMSVARQLRQVCSMLLPEILPYFDATVCT